MMLYGGSGDRTVFCWIGCGTVLHHAVGRGNRRHSFYASGDGELPEAGLLNVNGTLYGTTSRGGAREYGSVFSITTAGAETVLYSFGLSYDAEVPEAGLIHVLR